MGCCKQLLPLDGRPAIVRSVESLLAGGVDEVVMVINPAGEEVAAAISHLPVTVTVNGASDSDMAGSVRVGLAKVATTTSGVLIALADTPLVRGETCRFLQEQHRHHPDAILIPVHRERKGHPTLFPRSILATIDRHPTLRDVIQSHAERVQLLNVDDPWVVEEMDTPEDYRRLVSLLTPSAS
ncbi:glycosyl transferase [Geobacter sp. AOG1]|nr:glycosyl transferase [Geobacter sp. AOG1]